MSDNHHLWLHLMLRPGAHNPAEESKDYGAGIEMSDEELARAADALAPGDGPALERLTAVLPAHSLHDVARAAGIEVPR